MKILSVRALFLGTISLFPVFAFASSSDPFSCGAPSPAADSCNRKALHDAAVAGRHTIGYNGARERMFQFVDVQTRANGQKYVESCYSNDELTINSAGIPQGGFNTEHSWPQSYLKQYPDFETTRADLFHLFPVEVEINSTRGNYPFADCPGTRSGSERASMLCGQEFEPSEAHKGILARAMFYMSVSYSMPIDPAQESVFRLWNEKYPVTDAERERSRRVHEVQGNVNPFVDHPEWVDLIVDF